VAERPQLAEQPRPELRRALHQALVVHDGQRLARDRAGERVAAVRAAVRARREHAQHVAPPHHGRHRVAAARQRLAEHVQVGPHPLVVAGEGAAGAPSPVWISSARTGRSPRAQLVRAAQPAVGRDEDAGLALDRLREHGAGVGVTAARSASRSPYGTTRKPWRERPEVGAVAGLAEKPTMVVVRPWKLFSNTTISACPAGIPLRR
jgi:hypothetical protein